jgi:hypothetical protein
MRLTRRNFRICRRCRCDRWREHCEAWPAAKPRAVARVEHGVARAGARFPRNPADDAGPPEGRTRRPRRPFGRRCVRPQGERCCDRIGRWPGRAQYQRHASARLPPRSPARPDIVSGISATLGKAVETAKSATSPVATATGIAAPRTATAARTTTKAAQRPSSGEARAMVATKLTGTSHSARLRGKPPTARPLSTL